VLQIWVLLCLAMKDFEVILVEKLLTEIFKYECVYVWNHLS